MILIIFYWVLVISTTKKKMRANFRKILHKRTIDERLSLRVIYDKVATCNINNSPFKAHRWQMDCTRIANHSLNLATMLHNFQTELKN